VGGSGHSREALTSLRKVEEGERQLDPKENRAKAARRRLTPQRGNSAVMATQQKFSTRGAASSNEVWTLASARGERGAAKGVMVAASWPVEEREIEGGPMA
jgi:hypothetical protein